MAPVPDQSNWLTFSLYPTMNMMRSSDEPDHHTHRQPHHHQQQHNQQQNNHHNNSNFISYEAAASPNASSPQYFIDNFYANGYPYTKPQMDFQHHRAQQQVPNSVPDSLPWLSSSAVAPKLENFLDSSSMVRYAESQTDTQDSGLTMYEQGSAAAAYYNQAAAAAAAAQLIQTNSGSEVDDSGSLSRAAAVAGAHHHHQNQNQHQLVEYESSGNGSQQQQESLIAFSHQQQPGQNGGLSLGVNVNNNVKTTQNHHHHQNLNNCGAQMVQQEEKGTVAVVDTSKKICDTFGQRTSIYRGVTRHRWTGRYEAHLWDNSCRREGQARKGRQVYLGGYDNEDKAARAYDLAALKYWGPTATTNFPVANYAKELEEMKPMTKQEFIASLRRKSSGFSRGASIYRGVTRHHQQGRWQARIGRVAGNKDLYLGTFATEEEAAEAYDIAAIKFRGINAVTNFEMNRYDVEAITNSTLPVGGAAKRLKSTLESEQKALVSIALNEAQPRPPSHTSSNNISFSLTQPMSAIPCGIPFDAMPSLYQQSLYHQLQNSHPALAIPEPQSSAASSGPAITFLPTTGEYYVWPHQSY